MEVILIQVMAAPLDSNKGLDCMNKFHHRRITSSHHNFYLKEEQKF